MTFDQTRRSGVLKTSIFCPKFTANFGEQTTSEVGVPPLEFQSGASGHHLAVKEGIPAKGEGARLDMFVPVMIF